MNFKEKWYAYSRNFTNTTAPIQYEEFIKLEQFGRILSLPFLMLMYAYLLIADISHQTLYIGLVSYFLVLFILTYSVHVRMLHARGRSPIPFQVLHIFGLISCFIYLIYSTATHQEANFAVLAVLILIPSLTTWGNYFLK